MAEHENPYEAPTILVGNAGKTHALDKQVHSEYKLVRLGLRLFYYSIVILIASVIIMTLGVFVLAGSFDPFDDNGSVWFFIPIILLGIAALLMTLVGYCLCIAAPRRNEKSMAISMLVSQFLVIALTIASSMLFVVPEVMNGLESDEATTNSPFLSEPSSATNAEAIFDLIGNVLSIASSFCFVIFCKRIGKNVDDAKLIKDAQSAFNWYVVLAVFTAIFFVGLATLMLNPTEMSTITMVLFALFAIIGLGAFFKMVTMLQTAIKALAPTTSSAAA
jgi:MFS family permease